VLFLFVFSAFFCRTKTVSLPSVPADIFSFTLFLHSGKVKIESGTENERVLPIYLIYSLSGIKNRPFRRHRNYISYEEDADTEEELYPAFIP
jgi:hypothetical protein